MSSSRGSRHECMSLAAYLSGLVTIGSAASSKGERKPLWLQKEATVNTFDIQGIEIRASRDRVFEFVRDPRNLPRWTHAFKSADDECARLQTPSGVVDVRLHTSVEATAGTVDRRLDSLTGASDSLNRASPTQAEAP